MGALEWAHEVLSLASGSQTPPRLADLPSNPSELIKAWCGRLREEEKEVGEKEVLLRALRCCRFEEGHGRILSAAIPLLLDPVPSLRLQAAGCILQYVSSASSDTLKASLPSLVSTITRAFSSLQFQLPSAPSSTLPRLASTCLRLLHSLVLKLPTLPPEMLSTLATLLGTWIQHGRTASAGVASPVLSLVDRGRTPAQGQLAFGVMSALSQPPASPRRRARKDSEVSVASSRATSVGRGAESGSEDEGGQPPDRRRDAAQIRLDALTCLRTIATNNPKALHKHWPLFLADSPYLRSRPTLFTLLESDPSRSVRMQACAALSAMLDGSANYLAIAEDRPSKASFTSLSSSVGETISEMHISLSTLLALPIAAGQTDFRLALLNLAAKLAANSPYGRMQRPLAWTLAKSVIPMAGHVDPAIVSSAASTLAVIATRYTSTSSTQPFEWEKLTSAAVPLIEGTQPEDVQRAGWTLLAATVPPRAARDWTTLLRLFLPSLSSSVQEAQTIFLVTVLRLRPPLDHQSAYLPLALAHLTCSLKSPHPSVRSMACEALAFPSLTTLPDTPEPDPTEASRTTLQPWPIALSLASTDSSPAVRAAACRAVGLLAKADALSPEAAKAREDNLAGAVRVLLDQLRRRGDEEADEVDDMDEAGVAWALANCCDVLRLKDVEDKVVAEEVVEAALVLLEKYSGDEKTCTNPLRILGALFKLVPARLARHSLTVERVQVALCAGLAHSAAKVRWNASIASSSFLSALSSTSTSAALSSSGQPLLSALTTLLLTDSSFKARIHAVGALSAALPLMGRREEVVEKVEEAKRRLEGEVEEGKVPVKEKTHADVLMKRLDALLAQAGSRAA